MRTLLSISLVILCAIVAGCSSGPGTLALSCEEMGLAPGTVPYERCAERKAARQRAATRSAIDTVRSVDVTGMVK
jgi:hypothetical protein